MNYLRPFKTCFCEKHVLDLSRHRPRPRFERRSKFSSRSTARYREECVIPRGPKASAAADIQDRDGAFHLLRWARLLYAGRKMAMTVWRTGAWSLQIVKRSDAAGFEVLPKRWIVERTLAWISRNVAWLATSNAGKKKKKKLTASYESIAPATARSDNQFTSAFMIGRTTPRSGSPSGSGKGRFMSER